MSHTLAELFQRPWPTKWGLRGDVYLWEEMREQAKLVPLAEKSKDWEIIQAVEQVFHDLTDHAMSEAEPFYVKRLDPGRGMSAGMVEPEWWRRSAVPVLVDRAHALGLLSGVIDYPAGS